MPVSDADLPIAVLGAGSWGTALALLLARHSSSVRLWGHDPEEVAALRRERCNSRYLPGFTLADNIFPDDSLATTLEGVRDILIVVPSHAFRDTLQAIQPWLADNARIAWATKGFEHGSGKLLHEVVAETLGTAYPVAVISGPTFAGEVAKGLPAAITVASSDPDFAAALSARLHGDHFRAYTSDDVVGVEIGGAVKNVLAIAAGIADGLGFGANTRAALITRGLAEIMRLGAALGARTETFMGLAGLGDLALTCTDDLSRNRRLGLALAGGKSVDEARAAIGQEVEGIATAAEVRRLATRLGVEMPICDQTYRVLFEGSSPQQAVSALLARRPKAERAEEESAPAKSC